MDTFILTARMDAENQVFFNEMRERHFPKERNLLKAHLTLFHKLPDVPEIHQLLKTLNHEPISATVSDIKSIGNGVAYFVTSAALEELHNRLKTSFGSHQLSLQDQQKLKPHITIQNKVKPEEARALLETLQPSFQLFKITFEGIDLWHYLGGPWRHAQFFPFIDHSHGKQTSCLPG